MKIRATRLSLALMLALTVSPIVSAQDQSAGLERRSSHNGRNRADH